MFIFISIKFLKDTYQWVFKQFRIAKRYYQHSTLFVLETHVGELKVTSCFIKTNCSLISFHKFELHTVCYRETCSVWLCDILPILPWNVLFSSKSTQLGKTIKNRKYKTKKDEKRIKYYRVWLLTKHTEIFVSANIGQCDSGRYTKLTMRCIDNSTTECLVLLVAREP